MFYTNRGADTSSDELNSYFSGVTCSSVCLILRCDTVETYLDQEAYFSPEYVLDVVRFQRHC